ncbi:MAG TPA: hypothetical protein VD866_12500 [Urbifossiella sp.]|nr:hypothetical protein [Urbifossiella sp.]
MLEASTVCAFLNSPMGVALLALAVVLADRYAPPWVKQLLERAGRGKSPAAVPPDALAGDPAAAAAPTRETDDQVAELLGAVVESAAHRWPALHRDEAVERFTHDLRGMNLYYREQKRKEAEQLPEKERIAAAAAAEPTAVYSAADLVATFGPDVERYG